MKNIFRKSNIFSFILGAILFSGITGVVATTMLAKDVSYTPKDATWKVDNVEDAIDSLYSKANTTITELNSQISTLQTSNVDLSNQITALTGEKANLQSQLNNLSGVIAYDSFTPTDTSVKTITTGARPNKIIIYVPRNSDESCYSIYIYNENNDNKMKAAYDCKDSNGFYEEYDKSKISFSINATGFTYKPSDANNAVKTWWFAFQ